MLQLVRRVGIVNLACRISAAQMSSTTCAPAPRDVPFVLFGAGGVGSALLEAIVGARALRRRLLPLTRSFWRFSSILANSAAIWEEVRFFIVRFLACGCGLERAKSGSALDDG